MSYLCVYHSSNTRQPIRLLNHEEDISRELNAVGVRFERWQANQPITAESTPEQVMEAYKQDIERLKQEGGYVAVDVISLDEHHPDKAALRAKFLDEHTHAEDEVRFFVAGKGLFNLHIDEHVYAVLCEKGDLISVPAGVKHWFDMGEYPRFTAIRLFNNPDGWVAHFTGDTIAEQYPLLED